MLASEMVTSENNRSPTRQPSSETAKRDTNELKGSSPVPVSKKLSIGVNGYGVIGKRVAGAVAQQEDMVLAGVSDVVTDWRAHMVTRNG